MAISDYIPSWMKEKPSFDNGMDKRIGSKLVAKYTRMCFIFTATLLCVVLPLWYSISVTYTFFKVDHRIKHHILKRGTWFHRIPLYHNKSLRMCLFWCTLCYVTVMYGSKADLLHITKRLGRVAVALMPPLLFMTLRPSPLPRTLYLRVLPIHKWISRVVVLASLLHSILYAYYMCWKGVFWMKIKKPANVYGVVAMALFILIGVTSIRKFRRLNFRVFYYVHYVSTWLTVILIHFHARPGVPYYTTMNCAILLFQICYRLYYTEKVRAIVIPISPTLSLFEFPMSGLKKKPILPSGHVRISHYHSNVVKWCLFQLVPFQHPYTIASLPDDDTIKLIIRNGQFKTRNNDEYYVTGAFEPVLNFLEKTNDVQEYLRLQKNNSNPFKVNSLGLLHSPLHYVVNARKVLICIGGSAISFGLPLLRVLNFNGVMVRLLWVIRDFKDLRLLQYFKNNFEGMEIYISGDFDSEQDIQLDYDDRATEPPEAPSLLSPGHETCPLNPRNNSISYGSMRSNSFTQLTDTPEDDEVDFTNSFRLKKNKSLSQLRLDYRMSESQQKKVSGSAFRKDVVLETPSCTSHACPRVINTIDDEESAIQTDDSSNQKIKVPSGVKIYCGRPNLNELDYAWCLEQDCDDANDDDECCQHKFGGSLHANVEKLSQVWVVAAGPDGLVESTRHWATDGGLHFHAESFAV